MTVPPAPARPRRKLDREETERRLVMAFDRVWTRDGIQGLGVNAVLKEAGVGKALLYRYFGDFVGLARA
ncbi:MAG: helix-turn-helix transcriptional regulator [Sinobacteraceae bacterium]|nr:helix-turn-helix transcriptional regulator [Nevskiaceae bacterium]